jgi:sulfatase modifying factor 1
MMRFTITSLIMLLIAGCNQSTEIDLELTTTPTWKKIPSGEFVFGTANGLENESPEVTMFVDAFYLSTSEVTNRQFTQFVNATGYVTSAEERGEGAIFTANWEMIQGANWQHPMGDKSSIVDLMDHPVVQVSYKDAKAYCEWIGGRLPTEVEWEYACKKGKGEALQKNIWTGSFPDKNDVKDDYKYTAPVNAYLESDALGLLQMRGNVWEWCQDSYNFEIHDKWKLLNVASAQVYNGKSFDPLKEESSDTLRVIKGGSFLCHPDNCAGFLPYVRQSATQNQGFFHIGFRVAKDQK